MKITGDMHVHSKFSPDSSEEMDRACAAAVRRGLKYLCFSEHFELNPNSMGLGYFQYEAYQQEIGRMREKYGDKLTILTGLEFGEPQHYQDYLRELASGEFDIILGSIHWLGDYSFASKPTMSIEQIFDEYYRQLLTAVEGGGFQVVAHLDLPYRYYKVCPVNHNLVPRILKTMVEQDIVLEINTSSLRQGLNHCLPAANILAEYRRCGGSKVTVGSDAHRWQDIGAGFAEAVRLIDKFGLVPGIFYRQEFITERVMP